MFWIYVRTFVAPSTYGNMMRYTVLRPQSNYIFAALRQRPPLEPWGEFEWTLRTRAMRTMWIAFGIGRQLVCLAFNWLALRCWWTILGPNIKKKNVQQRHGVDFFSFRRHFAISFSLSGMIYVVIKFNALLFWHHWAIIILSVFGSCDSSSKNDSSTTTKYGNREFITEWNHFKWISENKNRISLGVDVRCEEPLRLLWNSCGNCWHTVLRVLLLINTPHTSLRTIYDIHKNAV